MVFFSRYFQDPFYLVFLALIPVILILYIFYSKIYNKRLSKFGSINYDRIILSPLRPFYLLRRISLLIALFSLIISASGPRYGISERTHQIKGLDIVIAVDVSKSMNAIDIKPSRLEKTRMLVNDLFRKLSGNRVGLVAFSGTAYVQSPLTIDYTAVAMFLDVLDTDLIPLGGSNIEQAVQKAMSLFIKDETKYKAIVLFTDGQETVGNSENEIKKLKEQGIRLFIIGVAGENHVPVPIVENGAIIDYQRDKEGNIVQTYLVDDSLRLIAEETGGAFYRIDDYENVLDRVFEKMQEMEKKDFEEIVSSDLKDQSPIFTGIALFFLSIYIILSYRTRRKRSFDFR